MSTGQVSDGSDCHALAVELGQHLVGIGGCCALLWRHYGVASSIGGRIDRSGWNVLGIVVNNLWYLHDTPDRWTGVFEPSPLAEDVMRRERETRGPGRQKVRMSSSTRRAVRLYLQELLCLLRRLEAIGPEITSHRKLRPARQIVIWTDVLRRITEDDAASSESQSQ